MARLKPDEPQGRDAHVPGAPAAYDAGTETASRDGTGPASIPGLVSPVDPRAVRVRLAAASRFDDEAPLRVTPHRATAPGVLAQRQVLIDEVPTDAQLAATGRDRHVLEEGGTRTRVVLGQISSLAGRGSAREVLVDGFRFVVEVEPERIAVLRERASRGRATGAHGGPLDVRAIIPGKVVSVFVAPGDVVVAGQHLLVVEAMKMQNELRAARDGTIERVGVAPGVNIEVGDLLVVIS
jgi:biotin carboxyl carrier protein